LIIQLLKRFVKKSRQNAANRASSSAAESDFLHKLGMGYTGVAFADDGIKGKGFKGYTVGSIGYSDNCIETNQSLEFFTF